MASMPSVSHEGGWPLTRRGMIGRERELSILRERFGVATLGRLQVCLVAGEPGVGKTRLLDELAVTAEAGGGYVLCGGASNAEGMPAYLPVLQALGRHVRRVPLDTLRSQAGAAAPILAGIMPEVGQLLGDRTLVYPLPPEQARLRLYEAIGSFFAGIAVDRVLLVVLDDLQWADSATLDLLCHVVSQEREARMLLAGAYRDGELGQNAALQRTIAELARNRVLTHLPLARLPADAVAALARQYLGAPVADTVVELLAGQSEGNAFFAEELLDTWRSAELIVEQDGAWRFQGRPMGVLPASITLAVQDRLGRLPTETVELLRVAAVAGRRFRAAALLGAAGIPLEGAEDRLEQAVDARLLARETGGGYAFSHDSIRECLYDALPYARRRRLHLRIAEAMEAGSGVGDRPRAELAFHFARGGDMARGVSYSVAAGEAAMRAYAGAEAMQQFQAALDLLSAQDVRLPGLLLRLGDAALLAGDDAAALSAYQSARPAALRLDEVQEAARAAHGAGRVFSRLERHAEALAAYEAALAWTGDRADALVLEILVDCATLLAVSMGRPTEGLAYSDRALDLSRRVGDRRLEASVTRAAGNLVARLGDVATGLDLLQRSLLLAETLDDPAEASECCACLTAMLFWAGELDRADEAARRQIELAVRCNDRFQLRHVHTMRAFIRILQGRWEEAYGCLREGRAIVERAGSGEPLAFLDHIEGLLAYQLGDYETAQVRVGNALAVFRVVVAPSLIGYLPVLGLIRAALRDKDGVRETMSELDDLLAGQTRGSLPTQVALTTLGALAVELRDSRRAQSYYAELSAFRGTSTHFLPERVLASIAILSGQLDAAEDHLDAAEAMARRAHMRPEAARTLATRAELELAKGGAYRSDSARKLLRAALDEFERLQMAGEAARVRERLRSLPTPRLTRGRSTLPAGLSAREAGVLRLLAAGRTNREIGDELALSRKTVANYVTSIFTKTNSDNRAAAAAFAIRSGLA